LSKRLFGGLAVAGARSTELVAAVRAAFMGGLADALRVGAVIAAAGVVLALVLMPRAPRAAVGEWAQSAREHAITVA
jgi:hypothetical protein